MVKVINPLFSNSAHGRVAGLVYESGPYGSFAKVYTPQRYKPTEKQIQYNHAFGVVSQTWKELTQEQKEQYNIKARKLRMSGFNLYVKENINLPE